MQLQLIANASIERVDQGREERELQPPVGTVARDGTGAVQRYDHILLRSDANSLAKDACRRVVTIVA